MSSKKLLLTVGILIVVAVAIFFIFFAKPAEENGGRIGFSFSEFFPFGQSQDDNKTPTQNQGGEQETGADSSLLDNQNIPVPRLRKISNEPVAGTIIFNQGTTSIVRFVEKGTGNVYEASSNKINIERLTNTTIPKIIRAFWLPDGSGFLAQTMIEESEIIETNFVKLKKSLATSTENLTPFDTTISSLPTGIKEISVSPDGKKIFYYTPNGLSSKWFLSNPDGTGAVEVYNSDLFEWLPKWTKNDSIFLQNKSSYLSLNHIYSLNINSKSLRKISPGVVGLSFKSNNKNNSLLISAGGGIPELYFLKEKETEPVRLQLNTLADKCIWGKDGGDIVYCGIPNQVPAGRYPDDWYKGKIVTEDYLLKIDTKNELFFNLIDLSLESGQKIDIKELKISPNEDTLVFINKIDGFLWALRIEE